MCREQGQGRRSVHLWSADGVMTSRSGHLGLEGGGPGARGGHKDQWG